MKILVGADPEVFIRNPNDGSFVCAQGLIPGTKEDPFRVNNGAVQVDGMAGEFNIDPAETQAEFLRNVQDVYHQLQAMVPGYELVACPVANFDPEYFSSCPAVAKELGCNPDYNAWTGEQNDPPQGERPFRTASGHVHVGWTSGLNPLDPVHFEDCRAVVRQLDYYLGVPSLSYDLDNTRRPMYGQAGAFRPKPYGVEYRVLSNMWLTSDELMKWVYNQTIDAVEALMAGKNMFEQYGDLAQRLIAEGRYQPIEGIELPRAT